MKTAIINNNIRKINRLLEDDDGGDTGVNDLYEGHQRPLDFALDQVILHGKERIHLACQLLKAGGISDNNNLLVNSLLYAMSIGHGEMTRLLLNVPSIDLNAKNEDKKTAFDLFNCKSYRDITDAADSLAIFLQKRASTTVRKYSNESGRIPGHIMALALLKLASMPNDIDAIRHAISLGYSVDGAIRQAFAKSQFAEESQVATESKAAVGVLLAQDESAGHRVFIDAAKNNNVDVVRGLLSFPIDVNNKDKDGFTAFLWASRNGHDKVVALLLEAQDISVNNKDGFTAFLWASRNGHDKVVALLLESQDISVNNKDKDGFTALLWASMNGHDEVVKLLLEAQGISVNNKDKDGFTALLWASRNGHDEVVKLLLEAQGIDVNIRNKILLQKTGNWLSRATEAVMGLFRKKDDHKDDYVEDATALIWASREGRLEVVKLLLEDRGIDKKATDKDGKTALISASEEGKDKVVKLLLEDEGVDMKVIDKRGKTALIWAAEKGHLEVAKLLVKKSTEVGYDYLNMRDIDGTDALTHAANSGCLETVELLASVQIVNMNNQNEVKDTALICATRHNHQKIVKSLLKREDINPLLKDNQGNTAFDLAKFTEDSKDSKDILKLFFKRRAKFSWSVTIWWSGVRNNIPIEIVTGALVSFAKESKKDIVRHVLNLGYDMMEALKQIAEDGFIAGVKTFLDESRDKCLLVLGELVKKGLSNSVATILAADKGNKDKRKTKLLIEATKDKADPKKEEDHEEIVRSFVEYGTNPCENVRIGGHTALSAAVSYDKLGMVKFLAFHTISNDSNGASAAFKKALSSRGWVWSSNPSYNFLASVKAMHDAEKSLLSDDLYTWAEAGKHEELVKFLGELGYNEAYEKIGRTVLTNAAYMGNVEAIQKLLRLPGLPEKVNARDKNKDTALILAASKGNDEVVEHLLKAEGIDVNAQGRNGSSALICAARKGHINITMQFLRMPAVEINSKNNDSMTAFDMFDFTDIGHAALLELFLARKAHTTARKYSNTWGRIPEEIMAQALVSLSLKPHISGAIAHAVSLGYSLDAALAIVAKQNYMAAVKALATEDRAAASRLLLVASENGNIALVKNLLAVPGIDINVQNEHGNTPLIAATANGHNDIANILIQMPAVEINSKNNDSMTAFDMFDFTDIGHAAVLELFLVREAGTTKRKYSNTEDRIPDDIMAQALVSLSRKPHSSGAIAHAVSLGYSLDSALAVVAKQNYMAAVKALATEDRAAASRLLVVAAENGNIALVKNLLAVPGIDINVQNEHGNTPLIAATANGHNDIANILIKMQGIEIYTRNKQGQTALDLFKFVSVEDSALLEAFLRLYKDSGKKIPDGAMIISQKISLLAGRVSAATLKGSSAYLYTEFSSMPKFIWVESLRKLAKSIMQNHGWNPYMQMRMLMLRQNLGPYFSAVPFTVRTKILSFLTRGDIDIREPVAVLPVANQEMAANVISRMSRGGSIDASSDSSESVDMDSLDLGGSGMAEVSAPGNM